MKQSMTNKNPLRRVMSVRGMGQVMTVTVGLIVLMIAFAIINPNFWSPTNRTNLLRQIAPILPISCSRRTTKALSTTSSAL